MLIKNDTTNNAPVILENKTVDFIIATNSSGLFTVCFIFLPDFITSGIVANTILLYAGNNPDNIPNMTRPYATLGKTQYMFADCNFPTTMTSVFLPFALSAS